MTRPDNRSNVSGQMRHGRPLALILLLIAATTSGCKRDLGDCNLDGTTPDGSAIPGPAALDIVYRISDGIPMYEGQALTQSTCGNGAFCHAPRAVGADRIGAPAGLDFDIALACTDETSDPTCTQPIQSCDGGTDTPYCLRLRRLNGNRGNIGAWAEGMIQEIRAGTMPPGAAGVRVRDNTPWLREDDTALPSIDSSEGQDIVRNWLACNAPVVARSEIAPSEADELQPCPSVDDEVCIYGGPGRELPEPRWSDIYWSIMFPRCVICHGPTNDNVDQNPDNPLGAEIPGGASPAGLAVLDLTGSDVTDTTNWATESWSAVVDVSASTAGACAGTGLVVVPFDSNASIMIEKMYGIQTCGGPMPLTGLLPQPLVDVVAAWVDLGAPND